MPKHRAILDPDGVYQGHEEVIGKMASADVEVPPGCDLEAGRYRWQEDETGCRFVPIGAAGRTDLVEEPHSLRAIAEGFGAIEAATPGILPDRTKRWLAWFEKTIDARG